MKLHTFIFFLDWSKCNDFTAPDKEGTFRLTARVSVNDDDILVESTEVRIKKLQLITLVQTDKPIYKPGQTGMLITLVQTDKPIYKQGQTGMLITLVQTDKPTYKPGQTGMLITLVQT